MDLPENFNPPFEGLREALATTEPSVSVRANAGKLIVPPPGAQLVPWCPRGWYLDSREAFTADPAMHQGLYYVQDASSMIISHVVGQLTEGCGPLLYLDACAAPGGKTLCAVDALPPRSLVVANEYVPLRAEVLRQNVTRGGCPDVVVTCGDTARLGAMRHTFDIVAADVPCSGEGMMRKDPEAVARWSEALVADCAALQRQIVDNLWPALKPGGYFIYSTCTFNPSENQQIVAAMIDDYGAEAVDLKFPDSWGVVCRDNCMHFLPGRVRGEGLTLAVVRKPIDDECVTRRAKTSKPARCKTDPRIDISRQWVADADRYAWTVDGDRIWAVDSCRQPVVRELSRVTSVLQPGLHVATIKGRDIVPTTALALSQAIARDAFPTVEVDYATAIAYLRREAPVIEGAPRGYVLLTYRGKPLGFVKNLGNRANNLYEQSWRILSTHFDLAHPPRVL